jgi:hypothetical protein
MLDHKQKDLKSKFPFSKETMSLFAYTPLFDLTNNFVKKETSRGFVFYNFTDRYGVKCSIQKSSLASEDAIWLGCDDANPRICTPGKGWHGVSFKEDTLFNTRMHLTQNDVKKLLPILKKFVKTGEI